VHLGKTQSHRFNRNRQPPFKGLVATLLALAGAAAEAALAGAALEAAGAGAGAGAAACLAECVGAALG
jgi:hypothetical protein